MKKNDNGRRGFMKKLAFGSAGIIALPGIAESIPYQDKAPSYAKGMKPVTITNVKAIGTKAGRGSNLVIVKVETSEPGLYGLGCATFTQRALPVVTAIDSYLNEFCKGRDVDNIEDMWQSAYVSSYWRNGPVLNNALSGLDQALWDIKGKRANMPVYQLLGGKCRFAVPAYSSVSGRSPEETADQCLALMGQGMKYVRIQLGGYGGVGGKSSNPDYKGAGFGMPNDGYMDDTANARAIPEVFKVVRQRCGEEVELCHDIHERLQPMDAINMCRRLEEYRPFFIEDPLSPENTHWWKQLRESTTVPFAMGELFNNINEFVEPIKNHYFDYIRIHVSQIGGITPAMKVARLGEWFNVRTAWHGPGDVSPVGHAANIHMDYALWNFGIQEVFETFGSPESDQLREVFPGMPVLKDGYLYVNEAPGLGVEINEKLAAKYPITGGARNVTRRRDGTPIRP